MLCFLPDAWICFPHHLFAEINPDQIVLKNVVVEHVLGRFAEINDPLGNRRWLYPVCHILRIHGAGRVVVSANPADAACDKMGVSRIFIFHKDAVAPED